MGITKDLVTGIWVGADDRSIHFKTSQTGEGSKTALPIFGKFMEKVYKDKTSGYTEGRFPKPDIEITKTYNCPSPQIFKDTLAIDSLTIDSLAQPLPGEEVFPDDNTENKPPVDVAIPIN